MFQILMNGVGDAFSKVHWGTHFLVQKGDYLLAIDCPDSYLRAIAMSSFEHRGEPLDAQHIDAMFLTHLHGDHVNGLEMTMAYRRFYGGNLLPLYTTPESAQDLWERRLKASLGVLYDGEHWIEQRVEDFLDVHVVDWEETFTLGPFTITTRKTVHHIPATALRITDGDATLGYSCDTAYDPDLIAWLQDADFIIHESSLGPAHTPLDKLVALPKELKEKMVVAHYPDFMIGTDSGIHLAIQGATYNVEPRNFAS